MNWDELQNSNKYPKDMCMSARIASEQAIERGKLLEIEQGLRSKIQEEWPTWEQIEQLTAEVKRLTSKNKTTWEIAEEQEVDITECRNENQRLLKESQLYKDLYTKVNTQNMVYKMALKENIPILKSVLQVIKNQIDYDEGIALGGVIVQLEKALEVDTNG